MQNDQGINKCDGKLKSQGKKPGKKYQTDYARHHFEGSQRGLIRFALQAS